MSEEKKKGFLSRLFGRDKAAGEPEKPADVPPPPEETPKTPDETPARPDESPVRPDAPVETPSPSPEIEPSPEPQQPDGPEVPQGPSEVPSVPQEAPEAPAERPAAPPSEVPDAPDPSPEIPADEDLSKSDPGPPETTPEWIDAHPAAPEADPDPVPVEAPQDMPATAEEAPKKSWFQRLTSGLKRSSDQLAGNITSVFTKRRLDDATLEELEDILIQSDLGIDTAMSITDKLRAEKFDKQVSADEVRQVLAEEVAEVLDPVAQPLEIDTAKKPFVILMVGVNGSGKTTTIGKLAQKLSAEGKSVMMAAGDTFRAAAVEQLQIWGTRTNSPVITRPTGADASGLAYDAVEAARKEGRDVLIIDTAGRLQNRDELMAELEKIIRVIKKLDETAPHATLLTLDATTGQNALQQAEIFGKRAGVTGLVMTKLDGTARGGILVAIARKFGLPVHYIGVGEGVDDLEPFTASEFAEAIAGRETV